jgi:hypothetical protein
VEDSQWRSGGYGRYGAASEYAGLATMLKQRAATTRGALWRTKTSVRMDACEIQRPQQKLDRTQAKRRRIGQDSRPRFWRLIPVESKCKMSVLDGHVTPPERTAAGRTLPHDHWTLLHARVSVVFSKDSPMSYPGRAFCTCLTDSVQQAPDLPPR